MNILYAILLGLIQGLTEFIPVSSTAHLLIGQTLLGIPADSATFSFLVIVQLGTLVSLFVFYWQDLFKIAQAVLQFLLSIFRRQASSTSPRESLTPDTRHPTPDTSYLTPDTSYLTPDTRHLTLDPRHLTPDTSNPTPDTSYLTPEALLGLYILLATIPALLAGYLLRDAVESLFRQPMLQAATRLFAAAILLSLAEHFSRKNRPLEAMTWLDALVIGLFQVIAVFPGASRSGSTISGGMFRGFERPAAARFAFLMSAPVMLAAGAYEMLDVLQMPDLGAFLPLLAVGFVSAAVSGWFAIRWLIAFLGKNSLYVFAIYCALAGLVCLTIHLL